VDKITRSKTTLSVCLSLACISWIAGCVQQKPSRPLSYDEKALWSFLTTLPPGALLNCRSEKRQLYSIVFKLSAHAIHPVPPI